MFDLLHINPFFLYVKYKCIIFDSIVIYTVKSEITHTLGGHQILWVITGYGFSQVYLHMFYKSWWTQKAMGYHRLWVITVWVISGLTVIL